MGNILASAYSRMLGGLQAGDACPLIETNKRAFFPLEQFHDEQLPDNLRAADLQESRASFLAASNTYWPILASEEDEVGWGSAAQGNEVGGKPDRLRKVAWHLWARESQCSGDRTCRIVDARTGLDRG